QRGRLESRALRRLSRPRVLARLRRGGRLFRARALLPPAGVAARAAALARERVQEDLASRSFTSACSSRFAGVGTPSASPRRATKPLRWSISVGLPRCRSCAVEEN